MGCGTCNESLWVPDIRAKRERCGKSPWKSEMNEKETQETLGGKKSNRTARRTGWLREIKIGGRRVQGVACNAKTPVLKRKKRDLHALTEVDATFTTLPAALT